MVSVMFWQVIIKAPRHENAWGGGAGVGGGGGILNSCSVRRWISCIINVVTPKAIRLFILMKCGYIAALLDCLLVLR